jgi:hypothetical protein
MTALSPSHGSRADFYIGTSGTPGTAIAISQYVDTASLTFSRDKAEVSTFKQLFKAYVAGMCDLVIPLSGPADVNLGTQLYGLFTMSGAGNAIQFQYAPLGVGATGSALWTGVGFLTKYEEKTDTKGAYTWTAEFQNSGLPVRTVQ